jgi:formate/nitrite transporter FocA (FNT family)
MRRFAVVIRWAGAEIAVSAAFVRICGARFRAVAHENPPRMVQLVETPSDEVAPKKSSDKIFEQELDEGASAIEYPIGRLAISGLAAGLELGLSLLFVAIARTQAEGIWSKPGVELLVATMSSFGFLAVILGRSELFTEQTTLAILPLLSGKKSIGQVGRLWAVVYATNLIGAALCAAFIVNVGPALNVIEEPVFGRIATVLVEHSAGVILLSAILAGWIMGLLSWLVAAARDTISQVLIIWIFTGAISLGHLHHSIFGANEVLGGVFSGHNTAAEFGHFLLWATLGNAIGGAGFVALLKYGHAGRGQDA